MGASVICAGLAFAWNFSTASACGVAYPPGQYVELEAERVVIVWDPATHTEHFIREPTFSGDPKSFGFFVPTPAKPAVVKESPEILGRVSALIPPQQVAGAEAPGAVAAAGGAVEVLQRVTIDDFELVTLKTDDEAALGGWLSKNGFVDKPSLRRWAGTYVAKGWLINAMRYAPPPGADAAKHSVQTPTLRFSFRTDEPFYPYTEPPADEDDRKAYFAKLSPAAPSPRRSKLDLYLVAPTSMTFPAAPGQRGPVLSAVAHVSSAALTEALGDTSAWGFSPRSRAEWSVSYLSEHEPRAATADLIFRPYDAGAASAAVTIDAGKMRSPKKKAAAFAMTIAALALVLGLAIALGSSLRDGPS
jgi:hypothetical protein